MQIIKTSVDLPEERYKALAVFMGWKENIMTEAESPNYEIPNPQAFIEYIIEKDSAFMINVLTSFNIQEAETVAKEKRDEADSIVEQARLQAEQIAKGLFTITVEK